jgi:hypothetical protein
MRIIINNYLGIDAVEPLFLIIFNTNTLIFMKNGKKVGFTFRCLNILIEGLLGVALGSSAYVPLPN